MGAINLAHASGTEGCEDFIRSEFSTRGQHGGPLSPLRIYGSRHRPSGSTSRVPPAPTGRSPGGPNRGPGASCIRGSDYKPHSLEPTSVWLIAIVGCMNQCPERV
jgi:hypothetical protein